jgi:predicted dithiol-disulfide oxidoreductase (DUF899 family)
MFKNKIINLYHQIFKSKLKKSASVEDSHPIETVNMNRDETVGTAPRTKTPIENISLKAQNLVWENEDASMQDKSYTFDEQVTDADYDEEDSLNYYDSEDERDFNRGRLE